MNPQEPRINPSIFENFPVLETDRLHLRQLTMDDKEEVLRMRKDERVGRFIARDRMTGDEEAEKLIRDCVQAYEKKEGIAWAGEVKGEEGRIIGTCGFNRIEHENLRAEIGGEMAVEGWGKGLAVEAVQAILRFGFEQMGLHSIEANLDPENRPALALLDKLGFQREGYFRERVHFQGRYLDMASYSLLASEAR